jgi:hypothetical protein
MSTDDTITAWGNHVDGAVALTKLRGTEQFKDEMSHAIFRAVRTMMVCPTTWRKLPWLTSQITSCVQRSKPIDDFPGTQGWIGNGVFSDENVANRLTLICIDLPSLRARANTLTTTPHSSTHESEARQILSFAQMVDNNLAEWYATLPPEWKHSTIGVVSEMPDLSELATTEKWPGEQHIYNDVPLASIVNDYRVCRIFCRRVIMACITWLGIGGYEDAEGEYRQSVYVIQKMVDDISACVPFHLDYGLQVVAQDMGQEQNGNSPFLYYFISVSKWLI